jgi:hypothetical protein
MLTLGKHGGGGHETLFIRALSHRHHEFPEFCKKRRAKIQ